VQILYNVYPYSNWILKQWFSTMNEDALVKDFNKGKESELLLNNPAFKRSLEAIEAKIISDISRSKWFQKRLREAAYNRLKAAQWVRESLLSEIDDGKLAKKRLES